MADSCLQEKQDRHHYFRSDITHVPMIRTLTKYDCIEYRKKMYL